MCLRSLAFLLLLGAASAPALAQANMARFRQLDTNHDGVVELAEYEAGARASFAKLDRDHDGMVTLDELRASIDPNTGGIGADGMARKQLMAMDLNYDNVISVEEFVSYADQSIPKYDRNGDGVLTSDDFNTF